MDPRRGKDVWIGLRHDCRGRAPCRKSGDVDPRTVNRMTGRDLAGDAGDQCGLSGALDLVARTKPVPALLGIGATRMLRVGDKESDFVRQLVHARPPGEILRALRAPVEHHDQRHGLTCGGGDVKKIVETTPMAAKAVPREAARCGPVCGRLGRTAGMSGARAAGRGESCPLRSQIDRGFRLGGTGCRWTVGSGSLRILDQRRRGAKLAASGQGENLLHAVIDGQGNGRGFQVWRSERADLTSFEAWKPPRTETDRIVARASSGETASAMLSNPSTARRSGV